MSATARAPLFQTASGRYIEISLEALQIATARHAQEGNTEITEGLAKDLADNVSSRAPPYVHQSLRTSCLLPLTTKLFQLPIPPPAARIPDNGLS